MQLHHEMQKCQVKMKPELQIYYSISFIWMEGCRRLQNHRAATASFALACALLLGSVYPRSLAWDCFNFYIVIYTCSHHPSAQVRSGPWPKAVRMFYFFWIFCPLWMNLNDKKVQNHRIVKPGTWPHTVSLILASNAEGCLSVLLLSYQLNISLSL